MTKLFRNTPVRRESAQKTTSRDGNDLTISLITAVTYDDGKHDTFAPPKAVQVAVGEKKGHTH